MATIGDLKNLIAIYMGQSSTSALTINGFDAGMYALNAARRVAERAHDFRYSETNCYLSIGSSGASITGAYNTVPQVTISGSGLEPDPSGTYTQYGVFNDAPLYMLLSGIAGDSYALWKDPAQSGWVITTVDGFGQQTGYTGFWVLASTSIIPVGTYAPGDGGVGGDPIVSSSGLVSIKRVKYVSLPVSGGGYEPVEFLTNDQYISRLRMQVGRQAFNSAKTMTMLGATLLGNPIAYQNAQTLYLAPTNLPLPLTAQLNVVRWLPDYTQDSDSDFITIYGPEFLQWQGIIEMNKYFKRFTVRQEGDIDEDHVSSMADEALQTLINWDSGIPGGTSEYKAPPTPPSPAQPAAT